MYVFTIRLYLLYDLISVCVVCLLVMFCLMVFGGLEMFCNGLIIVGF